jgi:adhesin transport system outer membrane protein
MIVNRSAQKMYSRIGSLAKTALPFFVALMGVAGIFAPTAYGDEISGVNSSFSDTAKLAQAEIQPPGEKTSDPAQGSNQAEKSKNKSAPKTGKAVPNGKTSSKPNNSKPLPDNLKDVVVFAVENHPQIAIARARVGEAKSGVIVTEANNGVQLDGSLATGYGAQSTNSIPLGNELFQQPNLGNGKRYVMSLTGKKLLYDFGTTDKTIARAMKLASAEEFNLAARINEIGQAMAQAYLNVVQTRELARLNKDNITALEEIQNLVQLNQTNGNGTVADVKRVEARLVDARAVAADNEAELQNALDRFQRLVKAEPGPLKTVPDLADFTPASVETAIALLPQTSPRLRADELSRRASELEIESKKSSLLPQIVFQADTTLKSYTGTYWNNFDAQALVSMTYKFMDGGLAQGQIGQLLARMEQESQRFNFDRDEAEADLRKFYITIASARSKTASLSDGVEASRKARDLYKEQFQGGKRTLFELLDIQTAAFNAERASILNMFEERRAVYGVLSTMGVFMEAVKGEHHAMIANDAKLGKSADKPKTP